MTYQTKSCRSDFAATATLNADRVKAIAAEHGATLIDFNDPKQVAAIKAKEDARLEKAKQQVTINRAKRIKALSLWSGYPLDFDFSDWDTNRQKEPQKAREIAKRVYLLALQLKNSKKGFNIVLTGTRGAGKTSLAVATMKLLEKERGATVMFVNTAELADLLTQQMQAGWRDGDLNSRVNSTLKAMTNVDVLVLDDLGAEASDGRETIKPVRDMLYKAYNARISSKKFKACIITTNDDKNALGAKYGARNASRLLSVPLEHVVDFSPLADVRAV